MSPHANRRFPCPDPEPSCERLVFGEFEFCLDSRELLRRGHPVKLQDQPARLVELLASRPGTLVERHEIRRHLWGEEVNVDFEQGINFCVKQVRRALNDSASKPRFVETVPRRGYRFVAPVRRTTISQDDSAAQFSAVELSERAPAHRRRKMPLFALVAAVSALSVVAVASYQVAHQVVTRQSVGGQGAPSAGKPSSADELPEAAREAFLEGVFLVRKQDSDPVTARAAFERALALVPDFAPAHAGLAESLIQLNTGDGAEEAARRAIDLDPELAEGHLIMGRILFYLKHDWPGAGEALERAIELDPGLARAHHQYAGWLSSQGRHSEALAAAERASRLDPASLLVASDVGLFAYFARQWNRAIVASQRVLALDPDYVWARRWIIYAALARGYIPLALTQARAEVASAHAGENTPPPAIASMTQYWQWRESRARRNDATPVHLAMVALGIGERDRALDVLSRTCENRAGWRAPYLGVDPLFDPLRSEPRFQAVLDCLGL